MQAFDEATGTVVGAGVEGAATGDASGQTQSMFSEASRAVYVQQLASVEVKRKEAAE